MLPDDDELTHQEKKSLTFSVGSHLVVALNVIAVFHIWKYPRQTFNELFNIEYMMQQSVHDVIFEACNLIHKSREFY